MKARRKSKRRRVTRARDVDSEFDRRMGAVLHAMRKGFGTDRPTFEEATESLRRQLKARGDVSARLRDVACFLSDDGRSATLFANWSSDDNPACANFVLPVPVTEREFDPEFYVAKAEATKH